MSENVFHWCVWVPHLLGVRVEGDRHVEQKLPMFDTADEILDSDFQVSGCLVDFLWVALSGLSQLLSCLEQLVCISVRVLKGGGWTFIIINSNTINIINICTSAVLCLVMFVIGIYKQFYCFMPHYQSLTCEADQTVVK